MVLEGTGEGCAPGKFVNIKIDGLFLRRPISVCNYEDGKLTLVCVCGKDVVAKGVKAPAVLMELSAIVGGGGGGRPDSATAGAKKPEKLGEALQALPAIIEKLI